MYQLPVPGNLTDFFYINYVKMIVAAGNYMNIIVISCQLVNGHLNAMINLPIDM